MKSYLDLLSIVVLSLVMTGASPAQQADWRAEKDLYKRVERGLEFGENQIDNSRKTYREGDPYEAQTQLDEGIETLLEAYQMVVAEGEDMRRRASRYKKVEIRLRGTLRKLEDFEDQAELIDRGPIQRAIQTVSLMQERFLKSMFQGGKLPPVEKMKP